eukprot:jgi/Ulvmu1/10071/UM006_0018.1
MMRLPHMTKALAALALLLCCAVLVEASTKAQRKKLAAHAIGINAPFMEAQRAGIRPSDSLGKFPGVWAWKSPAYESVCNDFVSTLSPSVRSGTDFPNLPGYFEAGNAVLVTAPTGFLAVQQAIGMLQFMPQLAKMKPGSAFGDAAGCLTGGYTSDTLSSLQMRQLRYVAATLSNSIVKTTADGSDFIILVGVTDSSTYGERVRTWDAPPEYSEKCYIGDMDHPASDIAVGAAAGLAMASQVLMKHGTAADKANARQYTTEAERAYSYAKLMYDRHGSSATCFRSAANNNCVGSGCTTTRPNGTPVQPSCDLYRNTLDPRFFLFAGAAAMYSLTGRADYRADADMFFPEAEASYRMFLYNWNNVVAQGVLLLSMAPDEPGAARSRTVYRDWLRTGVAQWSECSNSGSFQMNGVNTFCERTDGGNAYPLSFPWGNLGTTMNGVCMAGMYQMLGYDSVNSKARKDAACFMQRQLGYHFNHKCTTNGYACNTNGASGFSYVIGMGDDYPTKLHNRDVAWPNFWNNDGPDVAPLCGGLVSGPYENFDRVDGPTNRGTDLYENNRLRWQASEPAIDYTASLVCSLMSYAEMPDSLFSGCSARSPFIGRSV